MGHFLLLYIFRFWSERCIELIHKINLHKSKNQLLDINFNRLHVLLGFVYSNVSFVSGLAEEEVYQYLEHLFTYLKRYLYVAGDLKKKRKYISRD